MKPIATVTILCSALAAACSTSPLPTPPDVKAPLQWSEAPAGWKPAEPADHAARGSWWRLFGDTTLDALQTKANSDNLSLQAALARLEQARALYRAADASRWPQVTGIINSERRRSQGENNDVPRTRNEHALGIGVAYEVDVVNRVRDQVTLASLREQQSSADLESLRLIVAADIAATYFQLRSLSEESGILDQFLDAQTRVLDITRARHRDGVATGIDLAQQTLIVSATQAEQQQLQLRHARLRHLLATLTGDTSLSIAWSTTLLPERLPAVPEVLPGELLERRPDIASRERALAAAHQQVGIAHAGWYPQFTVAAQLGKSSRSLSTLLDAPSTAWSLGVALAQPLWDGGRTQALEVNAHATLHEATANYRNSVLIAWQEVEDALAGQRHLDNAYQQATQARLAAEKIADITEKRYQAGLTSAVERYTAQQNALESQRIERQLLGQRWLNQITLVKALGGGWAT